MRAAPKLVLAVLLGGSGLCCVFAQKQPATQPISSKADASDESIRSHSVSDEDRMSLLAAALDLKTRRADLDCSHLVHAIYEQAGLSYPYAPSADLYAGIDEFQRVKKPQAGDLVVWRGHAGIVIKPSEHVFFSYLSSGPGVDDYTTHYWKHRGKARFYRYIKSASRTQTPSPKLLRTKRVPQPSAEPNSDDDR